MRTSFFLSVPLVAAAAVVVACSSSSGGGGSNVSVQQACTDLANDLCSKLQSCYPFLIQYDYGDMAACATANAQTCPDSVQANGSTTTGSDVEACAQAYASASCTALASNQPPSACQLHGTLSAGQACGSDLQCSGQSYCNIPAGQACGVCAAQGAAGATCKSADSACQAGLVCTGSGTKTCALPGAQGATCDTTHPCQAALSCVNGTCAAGLAAGEKCSTTAQNCDLTQGLICNAQSVCAKITLASPGSTCGLVSGSYVLCSGGASCVTGQNGMGTCSASAANGQACGADAGACMAPAVCVNGLCTVPDATSCK
jgi:hypothetical protein